MIPLVSNERMWADSLMKIAEQDEMDGVMVYLLVERQDEVVTNQT